MLGVLAGTRKSSDHAPAESQGGQRPREAGREPESEGIAISQEPRTAGSQCCLGMGPSSHRGGILGLWRKLVLIQRSCPWKTVSTSHSAPTHTGPESKNHTITSVGLGEVGQKVQVTLLMKQMKYQRNY